MLLISIVLLTLVSLSSSVNLPPNFLKCNRKQPDLEKCLLEASNHGLAQLTRPYPELNIPDLNPFELSEATIRSGGRRVAVDQKFKNCRIFGLPGLKIDRFKFDFEEKKLEIHAVTPEFRKLCDYEMKGQLLVVPINGKGNSTIILKDLGITATYTYEKVPKKNGKTQLKFVSGRLGLHPELVIYDFENAFDKKISDNINQVLNENWKDVFDDVKGSYEDIFNKVLMNLINGFFSKVSLEEAFDS